MKRILTSMKNINKILIIVGIIFLSSFGKIYADDPIPPPDCVLPQTLVNNICTDPTTTPPPLNINTSVDVPISCDVTDTNNISHHYADSYLAICALQAAIDKGDISKSDTYLVTYPGVEGLFVNLINGCLLYTSPSPRDRTRSRMPSSA